MKILFYDTQNYDRESFDRTNGLKRKSSRPGSWTR